MNNDFNLAPLDGLIIIDELNAYGAHVLAPATFPPTPPSTTPDVPYAPYSKYMDVSVDNIVAPIDALAIFDFINNGGSCGGGGGGGGGGGAAVEAGGSTHSARIQLVATDLEGKELTRLAAGQKFLLRVYAIDTSARPEGVFATYFDVSYDANYVSQDGLGRWGNDEMHAKSARTILPGRNEDVGAILGLQPIGGAPRLVYELPMTAGSAGKINFAATPSGGLGHETLVFGLHRPLSSDEVEFGSISLEIAEIPAIADEPASAANRIADAPAAPVAAPASIEPGVADAVLASTASWPTESSFFERSPRKWRGRR